MIYADMRANDSLKPHKVMCHLEKKHLTLKDKPVGCLFIYFFEWK